MRNKTTFIYWNGDLFVISIAHQTPTVC